MRNLHRLAALALAGGAWLLAACATARPPAVGDDIPESPGDSSPSPLRVIYLIHGNGEYAWHDSSGARRLADRDALRQALETSSRTRGESFVFHLKRQAPLFGKPADGAWFHYRHGRRIGEGRYAASAGDSAFAAEARVLRKRGGTAPVSRTVLAWFGHEIPREEYAREGGVFGMSSFAGGLSRLQAGTDAPKKYSLLVLSSCYGGNPELLRALAPLADRVVASPAYLHLSHLDVRALGDLPPDPSSEDIARLADTVASRSFAGLLARTRTEITVATYEAEGIQPFLDTRDSVPPRGEARSAHERLAWTDCAELAGFDSGLAARGTRLLYRPPEFGPGKGRARRSAWQCAPR